MCAAYYFCGTIEFNKTVQHLNKLFATAISSITIAGAHCIEFTGVKLHTQRGGYRNKGRQSGAGAVFGRCGRYNAHIKQFKG